MHLLIKNWTSTELAELLVVLLANSDIVLGMLFLKQEKIIIVPNKDNIILPILLPGSEPLISTRTTTIEPITPPNKEPSSLTEKQKIQISITLKSTTILNSKHAKKWHNNVVKEFSDVFCNKPLALKDRR